MPVTTNDLSAWMGLIDDGFLEDAGGVDAPANPQTTEVLNIGGSVSGAADGADHDWYRVTLTAGSFYSFSATSTEGDLLITVRDENGNALRFDDDSGVGLNPLMTFEAGRSGVYYIDVQNLEEVTASYTLTAGAAANPFPSDPLRASTETVGLISVAQGQVDGRIDGVGDADWYKITLTAGVHYRFDLTPSGATPQDDPLLRLYDANGALVAADDDSGSGYAAKLWFTPTQGGVYYISAESYADAGGTYRLAVSQGAAQNPLDTIDLGTRYGTTEGAHIVVYFANVGETYNGFTASRSWTPLEKLAALAALDIFNDYAQITFSISDTPTSAMRLVLDDTLPAAGLMATSSLDGDTAVFNPDSGAFTEAGLRPGGNGYQTVLHEFGHALGLAHPHDPGGTSQVMEGVATEFGSYGAAGLNQGVFTLMSYNAGWPGGDSIPMSNYEQGSASTPMALDIAILQRKYGANLSHNTGNTFYELGGLTDHQYRAIWDAGGEDTISAEGASQAVRIDLRPATLLGEPGGGGYLSGWIPAMGGGYTIANGVVIEHAIGSAFNDILTGNDANNGLTGGKGDDVLDGRGGTDTVYYWGSEQGVVVDLRSSSPQNTGLGLDTLISVESVVGSSFGDQLTGDDGDNGLYGYAGDDILTGGAGDDVLIGAAGSNILYGQAGNDRLRGAEDTTTRDFLFGGAGNDTYHVFSSLTGPLDLVFEGGDNPDLMAGANDYDEIVVGGSFFWDYYSVGERLDAWAADLQVVGGVNNQKIDGGAGTQIISAYGGSNRVDAGAGTDVVSFGLYGLDESYDGVNTLVMKAGSGLDYVYEFESGVDKIDLTAFHFGITGAQVLAQAVNVDQAGTANDYCYFYLTSAGGVDNFVAFIGLLSNQLQASDFLT